MLKEGDLVIVLDFLNNPLRRKVVEILGDTLYVCKPEESELAEKMGMKPIVVGFNKQFVVSDESL